MSNLGLVIAIMLSAFITGGLARLAVPGPDLFAEDWERDLYAAIDLVTKKIEQQIRTRHNKYKARKHTEAARTKRRRQESGI